MIAATGFVSAGAGSVASANAVLLRGLLERGHEVTFFTKPSFVDPRPALQEEAESDRFHLVDCTNQWGDGLRRHMAPSGNGIWGHAWRLLDAKTYNKGLVRAMRQQPEDGLDLWLGDWARGRGRRPVVSFVQGSPGTDARSVFAYRELIERLSGRATWRKLAAAAQLRLSVGLPPFGHTDHAIVGSRWSQESLINDYQQPEENTHAMPYPIDLDAFRPPAEERPRNDRLRLFWLGRFAPRKRLDLLLNGLELAIRGGCDAEVWIVGKSAFAPGFEELIKEFAYPYRVRHWPSVPRDEVPKLLAKVDLLAQPSDSEDFGSSVAEALACGVPAIVGATNGTGDYVCENSIKLSDDRPETFAEAVVSMAERKRRGELADRRISRAAAENWFDPDRVVDRLIEILQLASTSL